MYIRDRSLLGISKIIGLFMKDWKGLEIAGYSTKWQTNERRMIMSDKMISYTTDDMVDFSTSITYNSMGWQMELMGEATVDARVVKASWIVFKSEYLILQSELREVMSNTNKDKDYWEQFVNSTMTVKELEQFFLEMNWVDRERVFTADADRILQKKYGVKEVTETLENTVANPEDEEMDLLNMLISGSGGDVADISFDVVVNVGGVLGQVDEGEDGDMVDSRTMDFGLIGTLGEEVAQAARFTEVNVSTADDIHMNLRKVMDMMIKRVTSWKYKYDRNGVEVALSQTDNKLPSMLYNQIRFTMSEHHMCDKFVELLMFSVLAQVKSEIRVPSTFVVRHIPWDILQEMMAEGGLRVYRKKTVMRREVRDLSKY
jgi:hypothetical protein